MTVNQQDVMRRALAAYFRSGATDQPSQSASEVKKVGGKWYAVLRSARGILACYRVRNDGKLKRLVRLPPDLK